MVGSRDLDALIAAVRKAGAKLMLVGDAEQLQPIAAGAPFRAIVERIGAAALTTVRRQTVAWQREATAELATGRTAAALARYQKEHMVIGHANLDDAKEALMAVWNDRSRFDPEASQIILAHRRADVRDLNQRARALRREWDELGPDVELPTRDGAKPFAVGERVYFLRNERSLGVRNGTLGTLLRIEGGGPGASLVVRLDDGREVAFSLKDYDAIDHGYAATVHKAQGVTVDHAHVLASASMDRHLTYVALSRHRKSVYLHWSRDEIADDQRLRTLLSRERRKENTLDYGDGAVAWDGSAAYASRRGLAPDSAILAPAAKLVSPMAGPRPAPSAPPEVSTAKSGPDAVRRRPPPPPWFRRVLPKLTSVIVAILPSRARISAPSKAAAVKTLQPAAKAPAKPSFGASSAPRPKPETSAPMQPSKPAAPQQPRPERAPALPMTPQPVRPPLAALPPKPPSSPPPEPTKPRSPPVLAAAATPAASAKPSQPTKALAEPQVVASSAPKPEPKPAVPPQPRPEPAPSLVAVPSPPPKVTTPAAGVAEALSRYRAVFAESARRERQLAATWQGSAAEEKELARFITRAWQAARAIVENPVLLAAFREKNPDLAFQVERVSKRDRDQLIDRARQQMPQPSPEPEPEPPTLGMRM